MRFLAFLLASLLGLPSVSSAAESEFATAGSHTLFVELVVNGNPATSFAEMRMAGDSVWIAADALREAGIAIAEDGEIDIASRPDFVVKFDAANQRLFLEVSPVFLPVAVVKSDRRSRVAARSDPGAVVNYDLFVQRSNNETNAALASDQRAFAGPFVMSNSGVLRMERGRTDYIRYDTRLIATDLDRAIDLTAGDLVTRSLRWTRSVRMGGIGIARAFDVRPDLVTLPLPSFAGEVAVPSAVDLFVNGYRQAQADLAPGRFVLDQVPVVTGAGEARVVTTDAVGRQVETVIPFYVAPELLRPGLVDFAAEAGFLRRDYALRNFSYGKPAASASVRRGMTRKLTLEAHGETSKGVLAGGIGAIWAPGIWGSFQGAVAASSGSLGSGHAWTLGYSYSGPRFGIGVERNERSDGFADLGDRYRLTHLSGSRSDRISASFAIPRFGSLGVSYLDTRISGSDRVRLASASLSAPLRRGMSLFAALDRDFTNDRSSMQIRLVAPLGRTSSASAELSRLPGGRMRGGVGLSRGIPTEGGVGFSADAVLDDHGRFVGQASGILRARSVQVAVGAASVPGRDAVWGSVSGSIAAIDGAVFAANALPGAFALVSTDAPNVPVSYENQIVGRTDRSGRLFVPRVGAWYEGRFSIDPLALDIGAEAPEIERRTAIRAGTGAIVRLPVARVDSVIVRLVDRIGAPIAVGSAVRFANGRESVVGWDGIILVEGAARDTRLEVAFPGGSCAARFALPDDVEPYTELGAVLCV
ncbi:MAG: fimbria/pilus outer membrane usher protein [Erythrobacter sp.]|nr:fimbria/pilus outer membrane usher protein [Erythrobacter sp.]